MAPSNTTRFRVLIFGGGNGAKFKSPTGGWCGVEVGSGVWPVKEA
ncbi:hypothetical protein B2J93_6632 [Marssonina coronariae]|uniref:Uncharacterized protein n=1 Tax=Diplocarpon coronariae TaxID=2795749 RepID=A0A218Z3S8_9HELO|nr:hypothetical protein B2J93_6632 [Marssonina coronariae]